MFIALLWFCTRLLRASLSTHQSCVKDTSASSLNMHFFYISNVSEIRFVLYSFLTVHVKTTMELQILFLFFSISNNKELKQNRQSSVEAKLYCE